MINPQPPKRRAARLVSPVAAGAPKPVAPEPLSDGLKKRLEAAIDLLDGRGPRGADEHDRNQARQLLTTHRGKLTQLTGWANASDDTQSLALEPTQL